jgi:hypothetical protein
MPLSWFDAARQWTNENSGFLTLLLFIVTIIAGWSSGIFKALRNRPSFNIQALPGPTFACTFPTGRKHEGHDTHRTAFCLYLSVTNRGNSPTDLLSVELGYHNYTPRYSFLWLWLQHETVALDDFQVPIGDHVKVYPFLNQVNRLSRSMPDTYLGPGRKVIGVVYFEQPVAWGGWLPRVTDQHTRVKVRITDAHEKRHTKLVTIPFVSLEDARRYNPLFGATLEALHNARRTVGEGGA